MYKKKCILESVFFLNFRLCFIYVFLSRYYVFMSIFIVCCYGLVSFEVVDLYMLLILMGHVKKFIEYVLMTSIFLMYHPMFQILTSNELKLQT
jgi:hypothetical protein